MAYFDSVFNQYAGSPAAMTGMGNTVSPEDIAKLMMMQNPQGPRGPQMPPPPPGVGAGGSIPHMTPGATPGLDEGQVDMMKMIQSMDPEMIKKMFGTFGLGGGGTPTQQGNPNPG